MNRRALLAAGLSLVARRGAERLYLTTYDALAQRAAPPSSWPATGLSGLLVILPENGSWPFVPGDPRPWVEQLRALVPLDLHLAFWANDNAGLADPRDATLLRWDRPEWESVLLPNLAMLGAAASEFGVRSVIWDSEIYIGTPGNSGGIQNRLYSWRDDPLIETRARQMRAALGSIELGTYCLFSGLSRLSGWRRFHHEIARSSVFRVYDEGGFLTHDASAASVRHILGHNASLVRGRRLRPGWRTVPHESAATWFYDGP